VSLPKEARGAFGTASVLRQLPPYFKMLVGQPSIWTGEALSVVVDCAVQRAGLALPAVVGSIRY
jgi:hypothetical protein